MERQSLAEFLEQSARAVVFTGAGVSTESGIPDFRSPGGIWTRMKPIMFQDYMASEDIRAEAWRRKFAMEREFSAAKPNDGHKAIAAMVSRGEVSHVITQNIDNLHQDSGVPAEKVIELHGNATYALCLDCGRRYDLGAIRESFAQSGKPPYCVACDGIVKTGTVSFGQPMPEGEMRRAEEAVLGCDLFLAVGSSLQVYPAAGFPLMAKRQGACLVIVNREETDMDCVADLVIHDEIGETLRPFL